jgi:DNA-directed RNA polymerase II subunit RPB2
MTDPSNSNDISTVLSSASATLKDKEEDKKEYHLLQPLEERKDPFADENVARKTWKLFDDYFFNDEVRLTQHHLDSYNHFISYLIPKIIQDFNPVTVRSNYNTTLGRYMTEYVLEFGNTYVGTPVIKEPDGETKLMYPSEARWRNLTYAADLYLDVYQKVIMYNESGESRVKEFPPMEKISLRSIPIMVKSKYCVLSSQTGKSQSELGECRYDKGGYFIVKGAEKVLVCQERKCENKVLGFHHNKSQSSYSHARTRMR